jgi:SAM-dependent methyltransferase
MTRRHSPQKTPLTARNADRHDLYQRSAQAVKVQERFLARIFEKVSGRKPVSLREDFCGTALLCAEWVTKEGRTAVGVDIDRDVLAWGAEHNLAPLGLRGASVSLLRHDVRAPCRGRFDVTAALNFSYIVFRTRDDLRGYFAGVRRHLASDGIFVLDAYGGYESWRPQSERCRLPGFTYVWQQAAVNPIDHTVVNYIHFEFANGSRLNRAFTYHGRLWTLPELRELLTEAGFSRSTVYWRDFGVNGKGALTYRRRARVAQAPAWVVFIVAEQ